MIIDLEPGSAASDRLPPPHPRLPLPAPDAGGSFQIKLPEPPPEVRTISSVSSNPGVVIDR